MQPVVFVHLPQYRQPDEQGTWVERGMAYVPLLRHSSTRPQSSGLGTTARTEEPRRRNSSASDDDTAVGHLHVATNLQPLRGRDNVAIQTATPTPVGCGLVGTVSWAPGATRPHASRREVPSPGRSPVARRFAAVCAGSRGCVSDTNGNRGICLALAHQRHSCRTTCSQHDASTVHCHSRPVAASGLVCHSAACEGGLDGTEGASGCCGAAAHCAFSALQFKGFSPSPISDKLAQLRRLGPAFPQGTRLTHPGRRAGSNVGTAREHFSSPSRSHSRPRPALLDEHLSFPILLFPPDGPSAFHLVPPLRPPFSHKLVPSSANPQNQHPFPRTNGRVPLFPSSSSRPTTTNPSISPCVSCVRLLLHSIRVHLIRSST